MSIKNYLSGFTARYWQILSIFLLGFLLYGNTLTGEFVWDDQFLIVQNAYIKDLHHVKEIFTRDIGAGSHRVYAFYRPVQQLSYLINYSLHGEVTLGYHIVNILLHILVVLAIYALINLLFADRFLSFFTSLLYLVHPIHVPVAAYISGRADSLAAIFVLLFLISYISYEKQNRALYLCISAASYVCALLSKEVSVIAPLVLLIYSYYFRKKTPWLYIMLVVAMTCFYFVWRFALLGAFQVPPFYYEALLKRIPGFFVAFENYLRILIIPAGLSANYGPKLFYWYDPRVFSGFFLVMGTLWVALCRNENKRLVSFSAGWFLLTLLPSSIFPINDYMAVHWLYLPSIGIFLILADNLRKMYFKNRIICVVLSAILIISYSCLTVRENAYWRNQDTLAQKIK